MLLEAGSHERNDSESIPQITIGSPKAIQDRPKYLLTIETKL